MSETEAEAGEQSSTLALLFLSSLVRRLDGADDGQPSLSVSQWAALMFLRGSTSPSHTVQALSEFYGLTRGASSKLLAALTRRGLVERTPSKDDGRIVYFDITDAGHEALMQGAIGRLTRNLDALPPATRQAFYEVVVGLFETVVPVAPCTLVRDCCECRHGRRIADGTRCALTGRWTAADDPKLCNRFSRRIPADDSSAA